MSENAPSSPSTKESASELNNQIQYAVHTGARKGFNSQSATVESNDALATGDQPDVSSNRPGYSSTFGQMINRPGGPRGSGYTEVVHYVAPAEGFVTAESGRVDRTSKLPTNAEGMNAEAFDLETRIQTQNGATIHIEDMQAAPRYVDSSTKDKYVRDDTAKRNYDFSDEAVVGVGPIKVTRTSRAGAGEKEDPEHTITLTGERAQKYREIIQRRAARNIGEAAIARLQREL